jgi:hypothetical protein
MADIDCPGCNPYKQQTNQVNTNFVRGNNDAGIQTNGMTPTYSVLTTDIGTQAKLYVSSKNMLKKPGMPNFGENTWEKGFNESLNEFDKRYNPNGMQFMPNYQKRYTLSGEFTDDGPLPSNG